MGFNMNSFSSDVSDQKFTWDVSSIEFVYESIVFSIFSLNFRYGIRSIVFFSKVIHGIAKFFSLFCIFQMNFKYIVPMLSHLIALPLSDFSKMLSKKIGETIVFDNSIVQNITQCWINDLVTNTKDFDYVTPFSYMSTAFLMLHIIEKKPIQQSKRFSTYDFNTFFAIFLGFSLVSIPIDFVHSETNNSFYNYLCQDDPTPWEVVRLLKIFKLLSFSDSHSES